MLITSDSDADVLQDVNILGQWPTLTGSQLDASQIAAVRRILGKKVAVIQGPPGTGTSIILN
jgi:helicase required for RNAi-mediated heterochromatin assembly 1